LKTGLLSEQPPLPDQKGDQANPVISQLIVDVTQPFEGVSRLTLSLIAE
jgi:hypothetical protein